MEPSMPARLSFLLFIMSIAVPGFGQQSRPPADNLQWFRADDNHLQWINVAEWESKTGGLQPVRVPKVWSDKWPPRMVRRTYSAAGMAVRFRTNSKKVVFRFTFLDYPEGLNTGPEMNWELSRPPYFDVYRDGKYLNSVPGKVVFYEQDLAVFDASSEAAQALTPQELASPESEYMILLPHYYRNAEIVMGGIGIDKDAQLVVAAPRQLPVVLFHGGSITHGHGATTPRETFVWQSCEIAKCQPINLGFGGSAWGDQVVADYIASRSDWDVFVLNMGQNSIGGSDSSGKPETVEQYGKKYDAFIGTVRAKYPEKPIICLTPILSHEDITRRKNRNGESSRQYRDVMQQVVEQRQKTDRNLYFIDGLKLVNDPIYLQPTDQVHPNQAGTMRLAEGVADVLKPILAKLKTASNQARQ